MQGELAVEKARAEALAKLVVDFSMKDGQELANVQNCEGFQDVHDFRGGEKVMWRLDRKKEMVAHKYDSASQLF
jgi:hypothetical protein